MKLLFALVALSRAGALPGVQSCCNDAWTRDPDAPCQQLSRDNGASKSFRQDLLFGGSPECRIPDPLTPAQYRAYQECEGARFSGDPVRFDFCSNGVDPNAALYPQFVPFTYSGRCNAAGHCYGPEDCQGTKDDNPNDQATRWRVTGKPIPNCSPASGYNCPALSTVNVPGFTGTCVSAAGAAPAAGSTAARTMTAAERACADKDMVLNTPLPQLTATLSTLYCESAEASVGLEFTSSLLASLDADKNGSVDCVEWGIAKQTTTLAQLSGGGYFGPAKLAAPLCKLSAAGRESLARYNAFLGKLTLGTLAANATAVAATAASRAVLTVENEVVAGSAAGALLAARDKAAAAWNATSKAVSG